MYVIIVLGASYGGYALAEGLLVGVAFAAIITPILLVVDWFNGMIGVNKLLVASWMTLSGVNTPGGVVVDCEPGTFKGNAFAALGIALLVFVLAIGNALIGLAAIVGIPSGLVTSMAGGVKALATSDPKLLKKGMGILTIGLAAMVVAGLVMRLMHGLSAMHC